MFVQKMYAFIVKIFKIKLTSIYSNFYETYLRLHSIFRYSNCTQIFFYLIFYSIQFFFVWHFCLLKSFTRCNIIVMRVDLCVTSVIFYSLEIGEHGQPNRLNTWVVVHTSTNDRRSAFNQSQQADMTGKPLCHAVPCLFQ